MLQVRGRKIGVESGVEGHYRYKVAHGNFRLNMVK
jgi:hypothetical protein